MQSTNTCRVSLLVGLILASLMLFAGPHAHAATTCQDTSIGRVCRAEVPFSPFYTQAYQNQYQSQWCWAASIAMVLAYGGHQVGQDRIVTEAYGAPVNMPAVAGIVMAQQVNREWVDDPGATFSARVTGLYDSNAGVVGITNQQIINELNQERPLLLGARTHAMVLTAVDYVDTVSGPSIIAGYVFDPWPGIGARALAADELTARELGGSLIFLAAVDVNSGSDGSGGAAGLALVDLLVLIGLLAVGAGPRRS